MRAEDHSVDGLRRSVLGPLLLCVSLALSVPGPVRAQAPSPSALDTQRVHGLRIAAPGPLRQPAAAREALERAVGGSSAIGEAQMYLWSRGLHGVSVAHYRLVEGGDYHLERGLRGALGRAARRLGAAPETGPDAYAIRETEVSGRRALVGSKRVERGRQVAVVRTLVTRSGRDAWAVTVFEGAGPEPLSEAVFNSLSVER